MKPTNRSLPEIFISSVKLVRDDYLRFLLILVIVLVFGSTAVSTAFGNWGGILILSLVLLFVLVALRIWKSNEGRKGFVSKQLQSLPGRKH